MSSVLDRGLRDAVVECALEAGFDLCSVAAADPSGSAGADRLQARFGDWIERGRAAEMEYLKRVNEEGVMMRASLHAAMPWARSVIVCALNYNADAPKSIDEAMPEAGWIARYAWSGVEGHAADYHDVLLSRLRTVETFVKERSPDAQTRCYVDTGPLVERHFAEMAGVGWVGKNACVINQEKGSWLLLGVVVTSLDVEETATLAPAMDRCGSCTRCLDACPTNALVAPRQMDAGLCISYLTIEKKRDLPEDLRGKMGRQVFGCDICQDVCPWNRKAPVASGTVMQARMELVNPSLEWLAGMDNAAFKRVFRGSPLERTGRKRIQRNVAVAMGNSGDPRHIATLERWAAGEDEILAEHASWALAQLREVAENATLRSASIRVNAVNSSST